MILFDYIQIVPKIHRTVKKKIKDQACPSLERKNNAYVCLETVYPETFIWEFQYIGASATKELEYKTRTKLEHQENGHFMGKNKLILFYLK